MFPLVRSVLACALSVGLVQQDAKASGLIAINHQAVIRNLDPVPNSLGNGLSALSFFPPSINRWGESAFAARLRGPETNSTNDLALLAYRNRGNSLPVIQGVAIEGQDVINSNIGFVNFGTDPPNINSSGLTSFVTTNGQLFDESSLGQIEYVLGSNSNPDRVSISEIGFSQGGGLASIASLTSGNANDRLPGIYTTLSGEMTRVAQRGDLAVGLSGGNQFFDFFDLKQSNNNTTFFRANHPSGPFDSVEDFGIWKTSNQSTPSVMLVEDSVIDEYKPRARLTAVDRLISVNNREDILFQGRFTIPSTTHAATNEFGYFVSRNNSNDVRSAWLISQPTEVDGEMRKLGGSNFMIMNGRADVFALASETDLQNRDARNTIFRKSFNSDLTRIVSVGEDISGIAGEGAFFSSVNQNDGAHLSQLFSNRRGDVLFRSIVARDDGTENPAVFYSSPMGDFVKLFEIGELIDISERNELPDLRSIRSFSFTGLSSGGEDGISSPLNDAGEFVMKINFQNAGQQNEGIFRFQLPSYRNLGDYNRDLLTSQNDLDLVLLNWADSELADGWLDNGDFDGQISQNELDSVLLNWGEGATPNFSVIPEPTTGIILIASAFGLIGRRRAA